MAIEPINDAPLKATGAQSPSASGVTANSGSSNTGVSELDFLKIFMQELSYQDPLNPVDNKEFMAQMAQFSALQEARESNQKLTNMLMLHAESLALSLIGKYVVFASAKSGGAVMVNSVNFVNGVPKLHAVVSGSPQDFDLSEVQEVLLNKPFTWR